MTIVIAIWIVLRNKNVCHTFGKIIVNFIIKPNDERGNIVDWPFVNYKGGNNVDTKSGELKFW